MPYVDIDDLNLCISDVWRDNVWQLQMLYTPLPQEVATTIQNLTPYRVDDVQDTWLWSVDSTGSYSVRSAYRWLLGED